jgi:hypothetical protein
MTTDRSRASNLDPCNSIQDNISDFPRVHLHRHMLYYMEHASITILNSSQESTEQNFIMTMSKVSFD